MSENNIEYTGLTTEQIILSREKYGSNVIEEKKESRLFEIAKSMAGEPMVILLLAASILYFISGQTGDGIFLAVAIVLVSAISLFQDSRSRNALEKLKIYTKPNCKVIRNGDTEEIKTDELVVGDYLIAEEGTSVSADGIIIRSNDFSVNESILTGESFPVFKDRGKDDNKIYRGTSVTSGLAIAEVTAVGSETQLGKIGKSLEEIKVEKTPLELQISNFVKKMVIAGSVVFMIVWAINYFMSYDILDSLLKALTLAMSILPEEIPVAFSVFMALGAWRLMKMGIVVKQMKTVETLGSATVICTDKTGTITENKMELAKIYLLSSDKISDPKEKLSEKETELIRISMFASEPIPFDPMEIALHDAYVNSFSLDERQNYKMIHEYPLSGKPPMMTHFFEDGAGNRIVASKGAPEAMLKVCDLSEKEIQNIKNAISGLTNGGYRVLGVGESVFDGADFPETQQELSFRFLGLIAFFDPPKKNIGKVFEDFNTAGIDVKIVTGDNAQTTKAIAEMINFKGYDKSMSGDELMKLNESELEEKVTGTQIFTRMFPEAKLRIINALKSGKQIVAMTGDGVNDGPALKAAHIGIAMGNKGTETAKQAASLILVDDDLSKMVDAVAMGRKIYTNLKKAIRYIISIHIPIVLTVFIPLAFGWLYPNIFSPVHIIFLELIMGPTCSIIYENEPIEKNTMKEKPRPFTTTFFDQKELTISIIQGLMITAGTLAAYQYSVYNGYNEDLTRTMVFNSLISANIFLTLVNRSFFYSLFTTIKYRNYLVPLMIAITIIITAMIFYIKPFADFFEFETPGLRMLLLSTGIGFISVIWFEIVKWIKRKHNT
ncbi:MAG TPA: cation-translocating P-type ATPase [Ignavibacteria bacterium]|nr:cation-translocating P-type ATPase [Ignavibacteria bacterium]